MSFFLFLFFSTAHNEKYKYNEIVTNFFINRIICQRYGEVSGSVREEPSVYFFVLYYSFITSFVGKRMSHSENEFAMSYFLSRKKRRNLTSGQAERQSEISKRKGVRSKRFVFRCVFVSWEIFFAHGGFPQLLFNRSSFHVINRSNTFYFGCMILLGCLKWARQRTSHGRWPGWGLGVPISMLCLNIWMYVMWI